MDRLVVFGCSSTYGQGLPDCMTGNELPSQYSWPSILAKQLGVSCINNSSCGSPNKKILLRLINFDFKPSDFVIVLWSFHHRGYILESSDIGRSILAQDKDSDNFYRIHNEYDMCVDTAIYMQYAKLYLQDKSITNLQFYFDKNIEIYSKQNGIVPINAEYLSYRKITEDMAWDNIHLGVKSHKNIADYIYEKINVNSRL